MRSLLLLLFVCAVPAHAAQISGLVVDASGAAMPGASVTAGTTSATTGPDGRFLLRDVPDGPVVLRVTAAGFDPAEVLVAGGDPPRIVLKPASVIDAVVVTASRGAQGLTSPAPAAILTSAELLAAGAGALDDALRNTPGFSLFRRSSSRASNPTTQGVTLRGVSGSGASRTLVLANGLPLNDAFGSWVYWNRIPQAAVERVEVMRGAAGDLYGADALGGVVQVLTFMPDRSRLRMTMDGGSHRTGRVSGYGSTTRSAWSLDAAGEWLQTRGVMTIAEEVRGAIDTRADSDYRTGFLSGGFNPGPWRALARVSTYHEDRGNGTPLQVNTTGWTQVSGESAGTAASGAWVARASGGSQEYYQTFTAVAADRASERLTTEQTTPGSFATLSGQWSRGVRAITMLLGAEARWTDATVEEIRYSVQNVRSGPFFAGGEEGSQSLYGRVSTSPTGGLTLTGGLRVDFWDSRPADEALPSHAARFLSPRFDAAWQRNDAVSFRGSVYRSHRTPTLNELHRGFRVGNVVTNPNPRLDPEELTGFEGGVLHSRARVTTRVTAYWNQLDGAITNVTVAQVPSQITRQRQNTDTIRALGVEVEADVRVFPRWTLTGVAVLTRSTFSATPAQPALAGNRVPQVPTFQVGGTATYVDPRGFTGSLQARALGAQFDDDLNELELTGFGVVDGSASQELVRGLQVFVAVENLFEADYDVGRTPLRTVGWPRTARLGVRLFLP